MATNEILRFSYNDTGTNLLTQSEYNTDAERINGNTAGTVARDKLNNKCLLQTSTISAGFSQFLSENQPLDITDQLLPNQLSNIIRDAFSTVIYEEQGVYIANATFSGSVLDRDAVAFDPISMNFVPALGNGSYTGFLIGIADLPNSRVLMYGQISGNFVGNSPPTAQILATNTTYYMANSNRAGHITPTPTNPNILVKVGVARGSNTLFFQPQTLIAPRSQIFTSNGNFTIPYGVRKVLVTLVGGGGGGGGAGGAISSGGSPNVASGGGAGGECGRFILDFSVNVVELELVTITIGAGGTGGLGGTAGNSGQIGQSGGNTVVSFAAGTILTANGGLGGNPSFGVTSGGQFSSGGLASGSSGGSGFTGHGAGNSDPSFAGNGGQGGSGIFSSGASGGVGRPQGLTPYNGDSADSAHGYGGGGGGGAGRAANTGAQSGSGGNGGNGANGVVIIKW